MSRWTFMILFGFAAILFATPALAQVDNDDAGPADPCFDAGSAWEECWTQSDNRNRPRVLVCYAVRSNREACRSCADQYGDNGQPTGYKVCAYVERNAACSCKFGTSPMDCTNDGSCTYFPT